MHISDDLAALNDDPVRQTRLAKLAVALKQQWWGSADGKRFAAALDSITCEASALVAIQPFAEDSGWALDWIDFFVAAQREAPLLQLPFRHFTSGVIHSLIIADTPHVSLSLASVDAAMLNLLRVNSANNAEVVSFMPGHIMLNVMAGSGELHLYEKHENDGGTLLCHCADPVQVDAGCVIEIDGAHQAFQFGRLSRNILMLRTYIKPQSPGLKEEFDTGSGRQIFTASADDGETRKQMLMALLRTMERRDAAPVMAQLSREGSKHIRWQAMRETIATDSKAGLAELKHMAAHDTEPELRAIAAQTLKQIQAQYGARAAEPR